MHSILPLPARREFMTGEASLRGLRVAVALYPAGLRIAEHAHHKPSITVVAGGSLVELQRRGGKPADCRGGAIVLRPAGDPHANDIGPGGVVNLELEVDRELLDAGELALPRAEVRRRAGVGLLATRLRRELGAVDSVRSLMVEGLALELLALSLERPRRLAAPPWLSRAHDRIHLEFRQSLSIASLARDAGVHPVAFARAFRRVYGVAPGELVRALRLDWAIDQLVREPDRSLTGIAADAGYADQSHFSRAFAARAGCSPRAYRLTAAPRRRR